MGFVWLFFPVSLDLLIPFVVVVSSHFHQVLEAEEKPSRPQEGIDSS